MTGELTYVGITQDRVPVGILERVHVDGPRRRELAADFRRRVDGILIVSTCERFELYATGGDSNDAEWLELLAHEFGFSSDALAPYVHFRRGADAARHLLQVAAGLESRLLGERNILRQVRTMYTEALAYRELGPVLSTLGRTAIHTGKRVRRDTALASAGESVVSLALAKLAANPTAKTMRRIIVLGTGMLAREALARLTQLPRTRVTVVSRSLDRARRTADAFRTQATDCAGLPAALTRADGVIACSNATDGFLVERRNIGDRRCRPLILVDLGMPRNIDPDVGSLPGVRLVQLGQLHAFGPASQPVVAEAEAVVERQLARFAAWYRGHLAARHLVEAGPQVAA